MTINGFKLIVAMFHCCSEQDLKLGLIFTTHGTIMIKLCKLIYPSANQTTESNKERNTMTTPPNPPASLAEYGDRLEQKRKQYLPDDSRVWECMCKYILADIKFQTVRLDFKCPRCGRYRISDYHISAIKMLSERDKSNQGKV